MNDQTNTISEHRNSKRYKINDYDLWHLKCADKFLPQSWIVDLNTEGACIRVGQHGAYKVGDLFPIRIKHAAETFVECFAQVKWKHPYKDAVNMYQLGLEFVKSPTHTSEGARAILSITQNHLTPVNQEQKQPAQSRVQFNINEIMLATAVPFILGAIFGLVF